MNSKTLIEQVRKCQENNWHNSDLWKESQELFEKITEHFKSCEECRKEFDAQKYPEQTLIEFETRLQTTGIRDWICNNCQLLHAKAVELALLRLSCLSRAH